MKPSLAALSLSPKYGPAYILHFSEVPAGEAAESYNFKHNLLLAISILKQVLQKHIPHARAVYCAMLKHKRSHLRT